jgi:hypothetical protein
MIISGRKPSAMARSEQLSLVEEDRRQGEAGMDNRIMHLGYHHDNQNRHLKRSFVVVVCAELSVSLLFRSRQRDQ